MRGNLPPRKKFWLLPLRSLGSPPRHTAPSSLCSLICHGKTYDGKQCEHIRGRSPERGRKERERMVLFFSRKLEETKIGRESVPMKGNNVSSVSEDEQQLSSELLVNPG